MKRFVILFCLLAMFGCAGPFNSYKEEKHIQELSKETSRTALTGANEIAYPAPTSTVVNASGNARVELCPPEVAGMVTAKRSETKSSDEKKDSNFSLDAFVESVPEWAWPLIIFGLIGLLAMYIIWSKTTAVGRASDSFIAGRIKSFDQAIDIMKETMLSLEKDSPAFNALRCKVDVLREQKEKQLTKQKPQK